MHAVILFDGICNFCEGTVKFVIAHDRAGYFKFAPLQSDVGAKLLAEHNIERETTDSVVLIEDGKAYTHSAAALKIAKNLDGFWRFFHVLTIVPRPVRDFFYKLFARYRYKLFGQKDECMLPTPEVRARFLATNNDK